MGHRDRQIEGSAEEGDVEIMRYVEDEKLMLNQASLILNLVEPPRLSVVTGRPNRSS